MGFIIIGDALVELDHRLEISGNEGLTNRRVLNPDFRSLCLTMMPAKSDTPNKEDRGILCGSMQSLALSKVRLALDFDSA